jgi:hypothetical protein
LLLAGCGDDDRLGTTVAELAFRGPEFQINTYTTGYQARASVAVGAGGDFVVVWDSYGQDGSRSSVFGQRFDNTGGNIGTEFRVNTYTMDHQAYPSVAVGGAGDFVVVWDSLGQTGRYSGVFGQRFDNTGGKIGTEFQINTYTTYKQIRPSVAVGAGGDFVVVWDSYRQDGSVFSVFGQRFDNTGSNVGTEFQINTYTTGIQRRPSVAIGTTGNFVVVWKSYILGRSGFGVFGQRFDNTGGNVGTEFQINTYTMDQQVRPSVAVGATGDFVVVWDSRGQDGSFSGVFGQRFDNTGGKIGTELQINAYTTYGQANPSVAVGAAGDFVVVWDGLGSSGMDTRSFSIQGRLLCDDADGDMACDP